MSRSHSDYMLACQSKVNACSQNILDIIQTFHQNANISVMLYLSFQDAFPPPPHYTVATNIYPPLQSYKDLYGNYPQAYGNSVQRLPNYIPQNQSVNATQVSENGPRE